MLNPEIIAKFFVDFPAPLATLIISALPVIELRGGLPLAITLYKMTPGEALFWSVMGNVSVSIMLVLFLERVSTFLIKHFKLFKKFFQWLFERTRRRAQDKIKKYGAWGLFLLVAIPLPMTGGWTGALVAFLFGISHRKAIPIIILGIITAGLITLLFTLTLKTI